METTLGSRKVIKFRGFYAVRRSRNLFTQAARIPRLPKSRAQNARVNVPVSELPANSFIQKTNPQRRENGRQITAKRMLSLTLDKVSYFSVPVR